MNFQGKAVLVYLEEDNIARAYFRIQPLMTQEGAVNTEAAAAFPDDGFLRIVPDKNEQHTFKERMRSLCGLCVMDLRYLPSDANKIRTNKNYSPTRGETNQYIVYSDAVRAMPQDLMYQVVAENDVKTAATPLVYIRNGANIQGPFRREDAQPQGDTAQIPPDSGEIHAVTQTGGQELLFYWPRQEAPVLPAAPEAPRQEEAPKPQEAPKAEEAPKNPEAPQAVPQPLQQKETAPSAAPAPQQPINAIDRIQEMNAGLSENANRLNAPAALPRDFAPEQPAKPLTGTRLYQAPARALPPRRAHNSLMETVEQQRFSSRMESRLESRLESRYEAPGAVIPQTAQLREVSNPMDVLKRALQGVWHSCESQKQAVDMLLLMPGMRPLLSKALAAGENDLTLAAMHSQLQDLEAERLMTLMQLDDAKKNLAAAREEMLKQLTQSEQQKLDEGKAIKAALEHDLNALREAMPEIEKQRQEAALALGQAAPAAVADAVSRNALVERVEKCLRAAGFVVEAGDALALLTLYAQGEGKLCFLSHLADDALEGARAFVHALGGCLTEDETALCPGGNAPVFLLGKTPTRPSVCRLACQSLGGSADGAAFILTADANVLPKPLPACPAVSVAAIRAALKKNGELTEQTLNLISALRKALSAAGAPLPLSAAGKLAAFIAATQDECKGGVAEAIDRGVMAFVLPHILCQKPDQEALLPLLAAMPRTLKALKNA